MSHRWQRQGAGIRQFVNNSAWLADWYNQRYSQPRKQVIPAPLSATPTRPGIYSGIIISTSAGVVGPPTTWTYKTLIVSGDLATAQNGVIVNPALRQHSKSYRALNPGNLVLMSLSTVLETDTLLQFSQIETQEDILLPFSIWQWTPDLATPTSTDWRTFRIHTGDIAKPSSAPPVTANNDDAAGSPLTFTVAASTTKYKVWLDLPISISSGVATIGTPTLASGTSGWSGYGTRLPSAGTHWWFLIAEITTTDDPTGIATIYQHVNSSLELPALILDPTVSPNPDADGCLAVLKVV